jgi:CarboxypepD_reg-like domain
MSQKINITIPKPCHENWNAMTGSEKGRFCDSCQKNVIDFTTATNKQIYEAFSKNNKLCGRFSNTQLNRDLIIRTEKSWIWIATTSAIISFLSMGNNEVYSQSNIEFEQTDKKKNSDDSVVYNNDLEKEFSGIVYDNKIPMPSVNVFIKGKQKVTYTGFDGDFKIKAKEGDVLVFSFLGYNNYEQKMSKTNFTVNMNSNLGGLVGFLGEVVYTKRRTLLGRTFHKIGNIFR